MLNDTHAQRLAGFATWTGFAIFIAGLMFHASEAATIGLVMQLVGVFATILFNLGDW